jgi:hypothetical protein
MSNGSKKLKQEPRMARHCRSPVLRAERKRNNNNKFLTSALDRGEWLASRLGCFNSEEISPRYSLDSYPLGPRVDLDVVLK